MTPEELRNRIAHHYENSDRPLLLSDFGKGLREAGLWPIEGETRSLAELIPILAPDVVVERDRAATAYVVVAPPGRRDIALAAIAQRRDLALLKRLPRAVLLAFCANTPGPVHLRIQPPYRYLTDSAEADENHILVDEEFRLPGIFIDEAKNLPPSQVKQLSERIRAWAERHQVDLEKFMQPSSAATASNFNEKPAANALERLYQAQAQGLRERLTVPLDIALVLSRMP